MAENLGIRPATIVIRNNKVLVVKSQYGDKEFYLFPGGGMEFGETIEETAIRETKEETGYIVKIIKPVYINEYIDARDKAKRVVNIFFLAELQSENQMEKSNDGGKIKQVQWIPLNEIKQIDLRPTLIRNNLKKDFESGFIDCLRYIVDYKNEKA